MLEILFIGLGAIGFACWYSYIKYMSRRRYITAPLIIDRIPVHTPRNNGYIPSVMDYTSSHINDNDEVPPKYEEINLHN